MLMIFLCIHGCFSAKRFVIGGDKKLKGTHSINDGDEKDK